MSNQSTIEDVSILIKDGTHGTHKDVSDGLFLLSAQNIINGKIIIGESDRKISSSDFDAIHRNYRLQDDDILVSIVGTLGKCAILRDYCGDYTFQRSVAIIRFDTTRILPKFAYYQILSDGFQRELKKRESKGAQGGVYLGELAKIPFGMPNLETQQKIVNILDIWSNTIETVSKTIELESRNAKKVIKTAIRNCKVNSRSLRLGNLCFAGKGAGLSKDIIQDSGIPCILYGELYTKYDFLIDEIFSYVPIGTSGIESQADDILIPASTTTNGKDLAIARVVKESGVLLGGDINIFRIKNKELVKSDYLALYLENIKWRDMAARAQGITIVHLYGKELLGILVDLPSIKDQEAVVELAKAQRTRIKELTRYLATLQKQYKYLLNHLINGDFDLSKIQLEEKEGLC